ncbi:MAG: GNAT family N-acetyltransferase [Terrimonas sp.]|nr:GNAT family N-acetyltransferase [Terrimonas sp.]
MFSTRLASPCDIPLIRELNDKVWPQTYAPILSPEQIGYMLEMMYSENSLLQQMQEGCTFLIVYHDQEPVGFASFQEIEKTIYKLHKIYVLTSEQGKGTGRFLLEDILDRIRKKNGTKIRLQVNRYNTAKKFYEKLGFSVIGQADFDIGNGFFMNDYIMEKRLVP